MKFTRSFRDTVRFFAVNAGFRIGTVWQDALSLARAESRAATNGWTFEWEDDSLNWDEIRDDQADCCSHARELRHADSIGQPLMFARCDRHEAFACVLYDADCNVLASLCGSVAPDRNYRRGGEAELAAEALAEASAPAACMAE